MTLTLVDVSKLNTNTCENLKMFLTKNNFFPTLLESQNTCMLVFEDATLAVKVAKQVNERRGDEYRLRSIASGHPARWEWDVTGPKTTPL